MSDANSLRFPPGELPPQRRPDDGFVGPLNELLAKWFEAHGVRARSLGQWVALPKANAAARLVVAKELSTPHTFTVRLDGTLQIAGLEVTEMTLGRGKTFIAAAEDGVRAWHEYVFPVLLAAFFDKPIPGKVEQSEAVIGGVPRRVTLGTLGTWGRLPEAAPGRPDLEWFNEFVRKVRSRDLRPGPHWVSLFYAQADGKPVEFDVTLDNRDWSELRAVLSGAPWPKAKEFYSVRAFLVIQDAETPPPTPPRGGEGSKTLPPFPLREGGQGG